MSWLPVSLDMFSGGVFLDAMEWGRVQTLDIIGCVWSLGLLAHAFTRYVHRTFDSMFA